MNAETLLVGRHKIKVIRSQRRSVALQVGVGEITLRCPVNASRNALEQFARRKTQWIDKHVERVAPLVPLPLKDGRQITVFEQHYNVRYDDSRQGRAFIETANNCIVIPLKNCRERDAAAFKKLTQQLKKDLQSYILERIEQVKPNISSARLMTKINALTAHHIKIKTYKRRWGCCHTNGQLSFNWRLAFAPCWVIDYVVVHELAHLQEFNHSANFWALVDSAYPARRMASTWLQDNGQTLYALT